MTYPAKRIIRSKKPSPDSNFVEMSGELSPTLDAPLVLESKPIIIGIDPGFGGAIALYDGVKKNLIEVRDPILKDPHAQTHWRATGQYDRVEYDLNEMVSFFERHANTTALVVLEASQASPQMGVTGSFRYGEGFGLYKGVLAALKIRTQLVFPSAWKMALGLSASKNISREMAVVHFPSFAHEFKAKKNHGKAEAALMAEYGLRFFGVELKPAPKKFKDSIAQLF